MTKISDINSKYLISFCNQIDVTVGDYLTHLKNDETLKIFAVYVEGFKPLDGLKFLKAVKEITETGKTVILYRAGRTLAGAQTSASHTASIAGSYPVTRELAQNAGAIVAETITEFEDLIKLFVFLNEKNKVGLRLGAISNSGFVNVTVADNLGDFQFESFSNRTLDTIQSIFTKGRLNEVVDIHNPLDLTGLMNDADYEDIFASVMEDENVDVGIISCVPMLAVLNTLPPGVGHQDDIWREDSLAMRLIKLKDKIQKPWVAVVEGGELYNPMVNLLEEHGIPTFRAADRAIHLFNIFCKDRLKKQEKFPSTCSERLVDRN